MYYNVFIYFPVDVEMSIIIYKFLYTCKSFFKVYRIYINYI